MVRRFNLPAHSHVNPLNPLPRCPRTPHSQVCQCEARSSSRHSESDAIYGSHWSRVALSLTRIIIFRSSATHTRNRSPHCLCQQRCAHHIFHISNPSDGSVSSIHLTWSLQVDTSATIFRPDRFIMVEWQTCVVMRAAPSLPSPVASLPRLLNSFATCVTGEVAAITLG